MSQASKEVLNNLHSMVARTLIEEIKGYKNRGEPIPPNLLSQAIKFLKDNGIEALEERNDNLKELTNVLPFPSDEELRA